MEQAPSLDHAQESAAKIMQELSHGKDLWEVLVAPRACHLHPAPLAARTGESLLAEVGLVAHFFDGFRAIGCSQELDDLLG
jgi:hypothetical protein